MTRIRDQFWLMAATCFGLGYAPVAPGTAGAMGGAGVFVLIALATPSSAHPWLIGLALAVACVLTVLVTPWAERRWGRKDPSHLVMDEVAGFLVTVLLFRGPSLWLTVAWAFVVTRVFDIVKPPPARQLEKLPAGWGVLLDDLCASLYAAGLLHVAAACFPALFGRV